MTRIAFIADVHVANHKRFGGATVAGLNLRCGLAVSTLRAARNLAGEEHCSVLVICGDLFDSVKPEPQVIANVAGALTDGENLDVVVLAGNHDSASATPGDSALAPLAHVPGITVLDTPELLSYGDTALVCVPYLPEFAPEYVSRETIRFIPSISAYEHAYLAIHAGIIDSSTPEYLRDSKDALRVDLLQNLSRNAVSHVFAGNWHEHKSWPGVVQIGALVPTGFDNSGVSGLYGSLVIAEGDHWERREVPGPRFLRVRGELGPEAYREAAQGRRECPLYVRWSVDPSLFSWATETLTSDAEGLSLAGWEVVPDEKAEQRARTEATQRAVASYSDLEKAITDYIDSMPLDGAVSRESVRQHVLRYLR